MRIGWYNFFVHATDTECSIFRMAYTQLKYLPIYFTLCVGVVSHILLFVCLIKDPLKCFRNSATYLIMNLALSDFIVCTVGLLRMILGGKYSVVVYISNTAMMVSLFSIFSIAIDRYLLTVHPFKHRILLNRRKIAICIASIWLSCLCLLVEELIFNLDESADYKIYHIIFIIVASVTFCIYAVTYFSLKRQGREISQQQSQSQSRVLQEAFLKTIMIVTFIQISTLFPACIDGLYDGWSVSTGDLDECPIGGLILFLMYCLNFSMNPLLYIWRLKNYRQTFSIIFC